MAENEEVWSCYILKCSDGSFYIGIATDVEERVKKHNWGVGPQFTARRGPVKLVWSKCCGSCKQRGRERKRLKAGAGKRNWSWLARAEFG